MTQPKKGPNKRTPEPLHLIRHYETLSPQETDKVVEGVAELIVNFVKKKGAAGDTESSAAEGQTSNEGPGSQPSGQGKGNG
jgi:hypothetical protein